MRIPHIPPTGLLGERPAAANENVVCESIAFLEGSGWPRLLLSKATRHALANGTSGMREAIAHGLVTEEAYYRALAEDTGAAFVPASGIAEVLTGAGQPQQHLLESETAWCRLKDGRVIRVTAPREATAAALRHAAKGFAPRFAITNPAALREAIRARVEEDLAADAASSLALTRPADSARSGAGLWHGFLLAAVLALFGGGIAVAPSTAFLALHLVFSLFFLSCVVLRLAAAATWRPREPRQLERFSDRERPVYSVLVALNREAAVVPDLVRSLQALHWPKAKLEIKLVCEQGDTETLCALAREDLDKRFEIIAVPLVGPQTKPKALAHALPFSTGSFITLYDAEDRPHPHQIEEAWQRFRESDGRLAALQAPLVMANPRRNLLTTQFHLEYTALFRGILQWLVRHDLPVPLGGTSTHFRREAVEAVGGWDPFNVTEDADLGFRLWQNGFKVGDMDRPTFEDAPHSLPVWLRQRTRWIKGWLQTWTVQTRHLRSAFAPRRIAGGTVMQILLAGTVMSTLFYPLTLATVAVLGTWRLLDGTVSGPGYVELLDWSSIVLSFVAYAALCLRTVDRSLRPLAWRAIWATPLYWLAMSAAGWRAVFQLFRHPFLWEKTPHGAHERSGEFGE